MGQATAMKNPIDITEAGVFISVCLYLHVAPLLRLLSSCQFATKTALLAASFCIDVDADEVNAGCRISTVTRRSTYCFYLKQK